jgi:hypothetical protein
MMDIDNDKKDCILRSELIKILRSNGFNCFPIPKYPDSYANPKGADSRYDSSRTQPDQIISIDENYGYIPVKGAGTCIIDLDHKENYRAFAEENIANGRMVIETPNGWHIPVKGLLGDIKKVMLYDYAIEPNKQIIEIQGYEHYCIGAGSDLIDNKTGNRVYYKIPENTNIIDFKFMKDIHDFIDFISSRCKVSPPKRDSHRSAHKHMRDRFNEGKIPTKGTSNDYFYNAGIQCLTNGLEENLERDVILEKAIPVIEEIYNKWVVSDTYSGRTWDNILTKINDAILNGNPLKEGRPTGGGGDVDTVVIAQALLEERKLYSDLDLGLLYEAKNGFLEDITKELQRVLQVLYPVLSEANYHDVLFKLRGLADKMPETNPDLIVFKNGVYSLSQCKLIETEDIADMGFKEYNYLEQAEPTKFLEVMFADIPLVQYAFVKAGLRSVIKSRMDTKISVIHGKSAVGKSTGLTILGMILGDEYHFTTTVSDFIADRATRAKIKNKRLLVFQDMPDKFRDFSIIKSIAGEHKQSIRGFNQANTTFTNKLKIWGSCNYLPEIPEKERNPMFTQRLSLITNIRENPFDANDSFAEQVAKDEGEQILSYLVNLKESDCEYENPKALAKRWLSIQSPEINFLDKYYEITEDVVEIPVSRVMKKYKDVTGEKITLDHLINTMKDEGYSIKYTSNLITNIREKVIQEEPKEQTRQSEL